MNFLALLVAKIELIKILDMKNDEISRLSSITFKLSKVAQKVHEVTFCRI